MITDVTIGISTKERTKVVEMTLQKLIDGGYNHISLRIIDDGSAIGFTSPLLTQFSDAIVTHYEKSNGYITRRNELVFNCKTKYLLSLDDDSFPVSGSLEDATEFANGLEDLFCLGFPIEDSGNGMQIPSSFKTPYQCRTFIGCGHLIDAAKFRILGGYNENLIHQGEEIDIAFRALSKGYKVMHFPDFVIKHMNTSISRNFDRMHYYGARNKAIWNRLHLPTAYCIYKNTRLFAERTKKTIENRNHHHLRGYLDGIKINLHGWKGEKSNGFQVRKWLSLPDY